jgi:hypothetical protein
MAKKTATKKTTKTDTKGKKEDGKKGKGKTVAETLDSLLGKGVPFVYFVPADALVEGHGFRAHVVFENHPDLFASGNWPYSGGPDEVLPWFWGDDHKTACEIADQQNLKMGYTKERAQKIVTSSLVAHNKRATKKGKAA